MSITPNKIFSSRLQTCPPPPLLPVTFSQSEVMNLYNRLYCLLKYFLYQHITYHHLLWCKRLLEINIHLEIIYVHINAGNFQVIPTKVRLSHSQSSGDTNLSACELYLQHRSSGSVWVNYELLLQTEGNRLEIGQISYRYIESDIMSMKYLMQSKQKCQQLPLLMYIECYNILTDPCVFMYCS